MEFDNVPIDGRKKLTASTISMVMQTRLNVWLDLTTPLPFLALQDDDSDEFEAIQVPEEDDNTLQGAHTAFKQPYRSAWRPDVSVFKFLARQ